MKRLITLLVLGFFTLPTALAYGEEAPPPSVKGRVSLTGNYYFEQEQPVDGALFPVLASPTQLAFLDARASLLALNLGGRVDIRFDGRARITQDPDYEARFTPNILTPPINQVMARGYLGGQEFEIREANIGVLIMPRLTLQLGRMHILEADSARVDALRVRLRIGSAWEGSLFVGGYPNPYSRSVLSDYTPVCGHGVAAALAPAQIQVDTAKLGLNLGVVTVPVAKDPCVSPGTQLSLAAGVTARYGYRLIDGSIGLVGAFFGGSDDGGPVKIDPAVTNRVGNLQPEAPLQDSPRVYVSWTNHVRPSKSFSLFSNLLVDLVGSQGTQVTRALVVASLRPGDRFSLRLSYAFHSPLAIDMYLRQQLYNRSPNGTAVFGMNPFSVTENNLTVLRTARHEARLNSDLRLVRQLRLYVDGRFRNRALLDAQSHPDLYVNNPQGYQEQLRSFAGDATLGLRDGGSIARTRLHAAYTFLQDFRAQNHRIQAALGRSFASDAFSIDIDYSLLLTRDGGVGLNQCTPNLFPQGLQAFAQINPAISTFLPDCFGRRSGATHEVGAQLAVTPWRQLLLFADYRFAALLTDPQGQQDIPKVFSHMALLRIEASF